MSKIRQTDKFTRGYSLTEIMFVVGIIGLVSSLSPILIKKTFEFFQLTSVKTALQRDLRASMELINRNLKQAQASTLVIDSASSSQPPCSRITFAKQGDAVSYTFYQDNTKLMMSRGSNPGGMLCENLRFIAFSFPQSDDMGIVSVSITLEKATYGGLSKAIHVAVEKVRVMNE